MSKCCFLPLDSIQRRRELVNSKLNKKGVLKCRKEEEEEQLKEEEKENR